MPPVGRECPFPRDQSAGPLFRFVSMNEGSVSSAVGVVIRARVRSDGGERRSCLYRPVARGLCEMGGLVPAAHFQREPSGG